MINQSNLTIIVADINIRQDAEGRFCLNDLHKAAGGHPKHRPSYWLENQQTIELAKECEIAGIPAIVAKQRIGTFVVKELVYAYAMWISSAFHVKVIRAYDALITNTFLAIPQNYPAALRALADEYERRIAAENKQSTPAQSAIKKLSDSELAFIQAWWECFGSQPVTASDLYRAVATKQCQVLNNSSDSLLGNITEWTAKKLSHALRRWSQLILDSYIVRCIGKTSHGLLWQLQLV